MQVNIKCSLVFSNEVTQSHVLALLLECKSNHLSSLNIPYPWGRWSTDSTFLTGRWKKAPNQELAYEASFKVWHVVSFPMEVGWGGFSHRCSGLRTIQAKKATRARFLNQGCSHIWGFEIAFQVCEQGWINREARRQQLLQAPLFLYKLLP